MCCALLLAGAASGVWAQANLDLAHLLERIAEQKQVKATFVEKKTIKGLQTSIDSSGELYFAAPHLLKKITLQPKPETVVFEGNQITLERNGRSRTIAMKDIPELAIHLEGIRALLLGDKVTLEKYYKTQLTGHFNEWKLRLTPVESSALKYLQFSGRKVVVDVVEVQLQDGDASVMRVTKVDD
jgi:outer membrane lipoprotein-sorting protein